MKNKPIADLEKRMFNLGLEAGPFPSEGATDIEFYNLGLEVHRIIDYFTVTVPKIPIIKGALTNQTPDVVVKEIKKDVEDIEKNSKIKYERLVKIMDSYKELSDYLKNTAKEIETSHDLIGTGINLIKSRWDD